MVSFVCEKCQETIKKPKLPKHYQACYFHAVTCLDCNKTFSGNSWNTHTSCISEAQKYEGALYKGEKKKGKGPVKKQLSDEQQLAKRLSNRNLKWKSIIKKELKSAPKYTRDQNILASKVIAHFSNRAEYSTFNSTDFEEIFQIKLNSKAGSKLWTINTTDGKVKLNKK